MPRCALPLCIALLAAACGPSASDGASTGSGGTTGNASSGGSTSGGTSSGGSTTGTASGGTTGRATGTSGGSGSGTSGGAAVDGGVTLDVPATAGSVPIGFDVTISASGADGLGASFSNGVGTFTPPGGTPLPAFIYERQPWPQYGYTLYQTFAVGPTDWHLGWFYCADGGVEDLEYEATDDPQLQTPAVTGSCTETSATVDEQVSLPSSVLALDGLVQGFTVAGPSLTLSGTEVGSMTLAGSSWSVFPFALVDCSTGCGTPGWYELHSVYWDAAETQTCFGIFYLIVGTPSSVQLQYSICLPDLDDPTGGSATFDSTWSGQ
jgi:hypothetical protein